MRSTFQVLAISAGLLTFSVPAFAHCGHGRVMQQKFHERIERALDAAKVSAEQRKLVEPSFARLTTSMQEGRHMHDALVDQALHLVESDRIDPAEVRKLEAERYAAATKIGDSFVQTIEELHRALSPAQRKAMVDSLRPHGAGHFGALHAGMAKEVITERIGAALDAAHATPAQRAAVEAAVDHATSEFADGTHRQNVEHLIAMFEAPTLDRAALDQLRAEHFAKQQRTQQAVVQAAYDVHDALSAEQRRAFVEHIRAKRECREE